MGKLIDEALRWGFRPLRFLDRMDDACQGGVVRRRRNPVIKGAGFVDRPGEHAITLGFVDWQAFAGNWRLAHRRAATHDFTV